MQTLLLMILLAGPAWTQHETKATLVGQQAVTLTTTTAAIWSSMQPAGFWQLHCLADSDLRCRPMEHRIGTLVDFDNDELWLDTPDVDTDGDGEPDQSPRDRGAFVRYLDEAGGVVTWEWTPGYMVVIKPERTVLASWAALVWPQIPLGKTVEFKAQRQPDDSIKAEIDWRTGGTQAEMLAARKAGTVVRRNGNQ